MKKFIIVILSLALFSCGMSVDMQKEQKPDEKKNKAYTRPLVELPRYKGAFSKENMKESASRKRREGYSIVKTTDAFDKTVFTNIFKAELAGEHNFNDGYVYYLIKSLTEADAALLRSTLNGVAGVVYSQPDYIDEGPNYTRGLYRDHNMISTMGLDKGNLDEDPLAKQGEYALRITKARNWYDENGNEQKGAYTEIGYGDNQVLVAIIDTGLDQMHKDFKDIVLYGKSGFQVDGVTENTGNKLRVVGKTENFDGGHHGTHCAGTICALEGNSAGIAGVAYKNTKVIAYKGLGDNGKGPWWAIYGSLGDLADIVTILRKSPADRTGPEKDTIDELKLTDSNFQITQKTVPVNMSLGGGAMDGFAAEMINKALKAGVLPVVAMGNEGRTVSAFPGATQGVFSVGATTAYDTKAPFSNSGSWINICAPGENIISSSTGTTERVEYMNGTSMATPFVTGTLAYLLSFTEARDLTPYQLVTLLENTADKITDPNEPDYTYDANGFSKYYGYGRVNVLEAAKALKTGDIPASENRYTEKVATFKVENINLGETKPLADMRVYVYDKATNVCTAVGITGDNGSVQFPGLCTGAQYVAKVNLDGELKTYEFTSDSADVMGMGYTFSYTKNRCFVSTCPNEAYPAGDPKDPWELANLNAPWLNVFIYDENHELITVESDFYKKLSFKCEAGKTYYCVIAAYPNGSKYEGGNYGLYIGTERKDSINVNDGTRNKSANDSYEENNSFEQADKRFKEKEATRPNGFWQVEIPANLRPETPATGNDFTPGGDVDIYKFIVPNTP